MENLVFEVEDRTLVAEVHTVFLQPLEEEFDAWEHCKSGAGTEAETNSGSFVPSRTYRC